jgi:fatty acyl-CoA reductase
MSRRHNYFGTQALMELASHMEQLRSFVHVSTYFVNNHMPRNSVVKEQLHPVPLELNGQAVGYKAFVEGLMAMSTEEANSTALDLMAKNNFNSSYAFGAY